MRSKILGILLLVWGVLVAALQIASIFFAIAAGHIEDIAITDVACLGVAIVMGWAGLLAYRAGAKEQEQENKQPDESPPSAAAE